MEYVDLDKRFPTHLIAKTDINTAENSSRPTFEGWTYRFRNPAFRSQPLDALLKERFFLQNKIDLFDF